MNALKKITKVLKALSDENRIRILYILNKKKGLCVCEIREIIELSQPTISSHLRILESNELITFSKDGKWVNYEMNPDLDIQIKKIIDGIFEIILSDNEIKKDKNRVNRVDRKELCGI